MINTHDLTCDDRAADLPHRWVAALTRPTISTSTGKVSKLQTRQFLSAHQFPGQSFMARNLSRLGAFVPEDPAIVQAVVRDPTLEPLMD